MYKGKAGRAHHVPKNPRSKDRKKRLREIECLEDAGKVHHVPPRHLRKKERRGSYNAYSEDDICGVPTTLWSGGDTAVVEIDGALFRPWQEKVISGHPIWVVYLLFAPEGHELASVAGTNIYVPTKRIRSPTFHSSLVEGSQGYLIQKKIWEFLRNFFDSGRMIKLLER